MSQLFKLTVEICRCSSKQIFGWQQKSGDERSDQILSRIDFSGTVGRQRRVLNPHGFGFKFEVAMPYGRTRGRSALRPLRETRDNAATGHKDDETSLIVRPFLDETEEEARNPPEELRKAPTRKIRAGKHYYEPIVFDVCPVPKWPGS